MGPARSPLQRILIVVTNMILLNLFCFAVFQPSRGPCLSPSAQAPSLWPPSASPPSIVAASLTVSPLPPPCAADVSRLRLKFIFRSICARLCELPPCIWHLSMSMWARRAARSDPLSVPPALHLCVNASTWWPMPKATPRLQPLKPSPSPSRRSRRSSNDSKR